MVLSLTGMQQADIPPCDLSEQKMCDGDLFKKITGD